MSDKKVGSVICFLLQVATGTDRSSYQMVAFCQLRHSQYQLTYQTLSVSVKMSGLLAKNKTTSSTFVDEVGVFVNPVFCQSREKSPRSSKHQNSDCYRCVCHSSDQAGNSCPIILPSVRPPPNRAEERRPSRALRSRRTAARRRRAPRTIPTQSEDRGEFRTVSLSSLTQTHTCLLMSQFMKIKNHRLSFYLNYYQAET